MSDDRATAPEPGFTPSSHDGSESGHASPTARDWIDYFRDTDHASLPLLPEDSSLAGILSLCTRYQAVMDANTSLAASLGAKVTGPRLIRGLDSFFEGTVEVEPPLSSPETIRWVDVVMFARDSPEAFRLAAPTPDARRHQFHMRGRRVSLTPDDWRLIRSGAFNGMPAPLARSFDEDEATELATLDIVAERASALRGRAQETADLAAALQQKIDHRRRLISRRRKLQGNLAAEPVVSKALRAELLKQFARRAQPHSPSGPTSAPGSPPPPPGKRKASPRHALSGPHAARPTASHRSRARDDGSSEAQDPVRALVLRKADKTPKGEPLDPSCDRCRRLRYQCRRNMTACVACTRKKAKCTWKNVTAEEFARLQAELGVTAHPHHHGRDGHAPARDQEHAVSDFAGSSTAESRAGTATPPDGGARPHETASRSPASLGGSVASSPFELAPIKRRASHVGGRDETSLPPLPRLCESVHPGIGVVASQAVHVMHARQDLGRRYGPHGGIG